MTGVEVESCPCGTGRGYDDCCGRLHRGTAQARTALELMRSRYAAFVRHETGYLLRTWHPQHRPRRIDLSPDQRWTGLTIHGVEAGGMLDKSGTVEFTAGYTDGGVARQQHETSEFVRLDGRWVYVEAIDDR